MDKHRNLFIAIVLGLILFTGQMGLALCVKGNKANLRSGPGTTYAKTWEVYKYMPLRTLKRAGVWYNVKDVDGDTHWIHRNLVTTRYKCAVIKVAKANLRNRPGGGRVTSKAEKYEAFRVLKLEKKWVRILDELGDKYWVFRNLVWIN